MMDLPLPLKQERDRLFRASVSPAVCNTQKGTDFLATPFRNAGAYVTGMCVTHYLRIS